MTESRGLLSFEFPGEGESDIEKIAGREPRIQERMYKWRINITTGGTLLGLGGLVTPMDLLLYKRFADLPSPGFGDYFNLGAMVLATVVCYGAGIFSLRRAHKRIDTIPRDD